MACKRKRSVTTEKPLSFSPWPMQIILLSLGMLKLPELCLAFSPPSTYHSPTSYAQKISISTHGRRPTTTRLYAFPKSSDTSQQTENQPFYAQDVDSNGQGNNYHGDDFMMNGGTNNDNVMESATNGNSGGMDAYAQQMQEFTKTSSQEEQPPLQQQTEEFTPSSTSESSNNNSNSEPISSVDARVLESILQDGKLDLSSEYEVKKLLEGPRLQEGEDYPSPTDDEKDGKFSSKFVSVSDVHSHAFLGTMFNFICSLRYTAHLTLSYIRLSRKSTLLQSNNINRLYQTILSGTHSEPRQVR